MDGMEKDMNLFISDEEIKELNLQCIAKSYKYVRDNAWLKDYKDYILKTWGWYQTTCSDNLLLFRNGFIQQFNARVWEMFLAFSFHQDGYELLESGSEGPDFKIKLRNGKTMWIEAVTSTTGVGLNRAQHRNEGLDGQVRTINYTPVILRVLSSLEDKKKKIKKYIKKNIIKKDDIVVIAVNAGDLADACTGAPPSIIERAVLSAGEVSINITVSLDGSEIPEELKTPTPYIKFNPTVSKYNEVEIETNSFRDCEDSFISAIIYSGTDVLNSFRTKGRCMRILHNDLAVNKAPTGFLQVYSEKIGKIRPDRIDIITLKGES